MRTELKEIRALLSQRNTPGSFAVRLAARGKVLSLRVNGSVVSGQVSSEEARRLCGQARPAHYGYKDETRLDPKVRDAWEIPATQIDMRGGERWVRVLDRALERIEAGLGIPRGCHLGVQLHNLLIYGPGQFFAAHQDSEKTAGMIGTLVVVLPSRATGGELVIEHRGATKVFEGSPDDLTLIAFYADCRHEVQPVKDGYRLALTYNLLMEGEPAAPDPCADIDRLVKQVRCFFETPLPALRRNQAPRSPPGRLVYLLDHQYTPSGLAWHRLKGWDVHSVQALREVAQRLDCEIFLALADVRHVWAVPHVSEKYSCVNEEWDQDDKPAEPDEELAGGGFELVDDDVELRHWVGAGALPSGPVNARVSEDEICYTTDSSDLRAFGRRAEPYMGNEGNTVERWYHRAAVVLWPLARAFELRAAASPRWAIEQVARALGRHGDATAALTLAQRLLPVWSGAMARSGWAWGGDVTQQEVSAVLEASLPLAAKLDDAAVAAALLTPFPLTALTPGSCVSFSTLLDTYGEPWCRMLLEAWDPKRRAIPPGDRSARFSWLADALPALCDSLCALPDRRGQPLARDILNGQWARLLGQLPQVENLPREWDKLSGPLLGLIMGATSAQDAPVHGNILAYLQGGSPAAEHSGVPLLRTAVEKRGTGALRDLGLGSLHAHCVGTLQRRLLSGRGPDDWSIDFFLPLGLQYCGCELCKAIEGYLRASDQIQLSLPLSDVDQVWHADNVVEGVMESNDLPITHTVGSDSEGEGFMLALQKTAKLFERREAEHRRCQQDLEWLSVVPLQP
jgi:hypothetical protein